MRNPKGEATRSLYLSNDIVKSIIEHNSFERLRLTAAGTKVFAKQEGGKGTEAQFRILAEGLPVILPFIDPSAIIKGNVACLKIFLESSYPLCTTFPDYFREAINARGTFYESIA